MGPPAHLAQGDSLTALPALPPGSPAIHRTRAHPGPATSHGREPRSANRTATTLTAELVTRSREGDRAAFDDLVRHTYADTYSLAFRLTGNQDDASDVLQDAYLRAFRSIRKFRGDAAFGTWLYRITANCASTHMSRRGRDRYDELDTGAQLAEYQPALDPEAAASAAFERDRVNRAVSELPPRLRSVVVLRDVYDLPHEAIAAELGISEVAAKVRLHRARKKLRERLYPLPGEEQARAL